VAVVEAAEDAAWVRGWRASGDLMEVETASGIDRHVNTSDGWEVGEEGTRVVLRGMRRSPPVRSGPLIDHHRPMPVTGLALGVGDPPPLDGTLDTFDFSAPLELDHDDQYRRSEEPYVGPEEFSATAAVGWDAHALYVAIEVRTSELAVRDAAAPPLRLDNEPDDIHVDGIQIYVRPAPDGPVYGFLVVPSGSDGSIRVQGASGTAGETGMVRGAWQPTDSGYTITVGIVLPEWEPRPGQEVGFDLLVNRSEPDRERRSGQLVWSGGGGWIYLRGDRHDPSAFGVLELR